MWNTRHLPWPHGCTALTQTPSISCNAELCSTCLHTRRDLLSLCCPSLLAAGTLKRQCWWWESNQTFLAPVCVPVLPHAPSETVNHPGLLAGFVILNRAWTQLSRGESTMSYCNSFCQPILSWTQQYFNLKIQPQNPQHFQLLYFITTQLKTTLFGFFFQPLLFF